MIIVGLSGTNGSGKDTIAELLASEHGFVFVDATTILGDELIRQGLPTDRVHKSQLSAAWRREFGMAVLVDKAIEIFKQGNFEGLVVSSLRHPSEADRVHELGGKVVWVDADPSIRYKRITSNDRGRLEDKKSFDDWQADEYREMHPEGDGATLNGDAVKERADLFLENNGSDIEKFKEVARDFIQIKLLI